MTSSMEGDLRRALHRVEAPGGFVDRVMASLPHKPGRNRFWLAAVAAGVAILGLFGIEQRRYEHRMVAEQEQQRVLFALSLASEKVDHAMSRANVRLQRSAPDITIDMGERGRL
jgi:hypothetical protein